VLVVGQAESLGTDVPPVIEESAKQRVDGYARRAESDGRLLGPNGELPGEGWFCPPRIATDLSPGSPVLLEEIFGPLLAVERVTDVAEACDIVDDLPFALTGGLFSRNPDTVAAVAARTPVGNLYVNRAITGAKVGRQPFGGNRLSGTGIKAGGPHYLLQFVDGQVVTENTMRHGLAI
jgi:RHH-type proline utilization regulon transcriptional repressor/proline dehydrogenase/delta 1-pyrroline-5-carboxylate dehydrogenase